MACSCVHVRQIESLAQHLQKTCAAFRATTSRGAPIACTQLAAFLRSCTTVTFPAGHEAEELLVRGAETGHCVVVLEGRLLVTDGDGNGGVSLINECALRLAATNCAVGWTADWTAAHAAGPWTALAADSLVTQEGLFFADATVRTAPEVATRVLRIARADFQRRLLRPLSRRDSRAVLTAAAALAAASALAQ